MIQTIKILEQLCQILKIQPPPPKQTKKTPIDKKVVLLMIITKIKFHIQWGSVYLHVTKQTVHRPSEIRYSTKLINKEFAKERTGHVYSVQYHEFEV